MSQNDKYCRPLVSSTNDDNVYDALDVIQRNAKQIVQRMNTCVTRGTGRSSKVVFYDWLPNGTYSFTANGAKCDATVEGAGSTRWTENRRYRSDIVLPKHCSSAPHGRAPDLV